MLPVILHVWLLSWQASPSSEGWPLESLRNEAEADSLYLGSPIRRHRELPIRQIYSDRNVSHEWSPKLTSKRSLTQVQRLPSAINFCKLLIFKHVYTFAEILSFHNRLTISH